MSSRSFVNPRRTYPVRARHDHRFVVRSEGRAQETAGAVEDPFSRVGMKRKVVDEKHDTPRLGGGFSACAPTGRRDRAALLDLEKFVIFCGAPLSRISSRPAAGR